VTRDKLPSVPGTVTRLGEIVDCVLRGHSLHATIQVGPRCENSRPRGTEAVTSARQASYRSRSLPSFAQAFSSVHD
jgi:hypothetical protein